MSERHCDGVLAIKQEMISTKLACSLVSCSLPTLLIVNRNIDMVRKAGNISTEKTENVAKVDTRQ